MEQRLQVKPVASCTTCIIAEEVTEKLCLYGGCGGEARVSKQGVVTATQEGDVTWTVNRKALCLDFIHFRRQATAGYFGRLREWVRCKLFTMARTIE